MRLLTWLASDVFRHLPPVRSPLTLPALRAGWGAAHNQRAAAAAEAALRVALAARFEGAGVVFTDSGTSALALALRFSAGAERAPIALPAYGCYDLATAADAAGCAVVLYDVDPTSLSPVESSLHAALELGARTVVVAHLYGVPVDLGAVRALATRFGAQLVDDAAQGVGGAFGGVPLGLHGVLGILSFGRGKGMTGGSGGALLVPVDSPLRDAAMGLGLPPASTAPLRALLTTTAQWALARPELYGIPAALPFLGLGETHYRPPHAATGISAFALGVLSCTAGLVEGELEVRQAHADFLRRALIKSVARGIEPPSGSTPGYLRFPVRIPTRQRAAATSAQVLGIMPGYPTSLASLSGFGERCLNARVAMPGAEELAATLFTLPTHGALAPHDLRRLERWLESLVP